MFCEDSDTQIIVIFGIALCISGTGNLEAGLQIW